VLRHASLFDLNILWPGSHPLSRPVILKVQSQPSKTLQNLHIQADALVKMSASTSQLEEEIDSLASQVKTLEVEISSNPQPRTVCRPCGPRWLSLLPYKRTSDFFEKWEGNTKDLIDTPATLQNMMQEDDIMSDSQISHFELDASATTDKTEEELDMLENAKCRTLGALRCYHFNLGMGTLVTGEKVDEGVERALRRLLEPSKGIGEGLICSEKMEKSGSSQGGELSDEKRLVSIVDCYIQQVGSCGLEPAEHVVDLARKILDWAKEHGITDDEKEHQKSMAWAHWWRWT